MLKWIPLNYYALTGLLNFITSFVLSIFVFSKNPKSRTNQTFSLFAFTVAGWALCYFLWLNTEKCYLAEFYLQTLMVFVIFIPSTFTHFILTLTKVDYNKKIILGNYLISALLVATAYTKLFASDIGPFLVFPYWLKPRFFFVIHSIHFFANVIFSHFLMLRTIKHQSGIFRNQVLYVFIGTAIGYAGGAINYLTWYRIPIPPFLNPLVSIYVALVSYAIFKYRLMDITLVFRSGLIFLPYAVISIVALVIINALSHNLFWINVGAISLILSAPFIYQYLQRHSRAVIDSTIYRSKFAYIEIMEEFIDGMPLIPGEKDLFRNTVKTTTETFGVKKMAIFIFDDIFNNYRVREQEGLDNIGEFNISDNNGVVSWLKKNRGIFVKEEMEKVLKHDEIAPIKEVLGKVEASVCVPVMLKENLMGIITLGEKTSGDMYSHIDGRILERLGNQLAITLNHIKTVDEFHKERQQAEIIKNTLDTITSMAVGFADRLGNNLVSLKTFFDLFPERMKQIAGEERSEARENLESFANTTNFSVDKLMALNLLMRSFYKPPKNIFQKYEPKEIVNIVNELKETLKPDIGNKQIKVDCTIVGNPPSTVFDRDTIKEVLRHVLQNSIHAITETAKGHILVKITGPVKRDDKEFLRIIIEDNGKGIPEDFREKLFVPFETTKGTAGGLGLGLVSCRFFITRHEGEIRLVKSEVDRGTIFHIDLPAKIEPPKPGIDYKDIISMFPARKK